MRIRFFYYALILCVSLGAVPKTASADAFSFTGIFSTDDQLETFSFVAGPGNAILQTWGFAGTNGGTNAKGQTIAPGGFDPVLSLFGPGPLQASTPLLTTNDNGGANVPADPGSGEQFDSFIDTASPPTLVALIPGQTYFLILTESPSNPNGNTFGDGFSGQGQGNYTSSIYGCGGGPFCDVDAQQRDGNWAVDISGVTAAQDTTVGTVPEPGSFWLLGCVGALILGIHRKFLAGRECR